MCTDCGCIAQHASATHETVALVHDLLAANDAGAAHNRRGFDRRRLLAVNLMSSPGAGKTALLEATAAALGGELRIAVIEGDLATDRDARRLRERGVPAVQITTGTACHLDAALVHRAVQMLDLAGIDLLFIENVGNLVCPAAFDLGQHRNVTLLSAPEGDDKPAKYPVMFRASDLLLLSKADLLPVLGDFDPARTEQALRDLANPAPVLTLSARSSAGLRAWCDWLRTSLHAQRAALDRGATTLPGRRAAAHGPRHAALHDD